MSDKNQFTRRGLLKTVGGAALVSGISAPAILRAQTADVIRIGHLTPRTGFLGPLGEYAVMAIDLAVEEINAAGGMMGRKVEVLKEDSVNPQTASTKAERMIETPSTSAADRSDNFSPGASRPEISKSANWA